jgi:hypothetical protein
LRSGCWLPRARRAAVPQPGEVTFYLSLPSSADGLSEAATKAATPGSPDHRHFSWLDVAARQFGATDAQIEAVAKSVGTLGLQFAADPPRLFGRVTGSTAWWQAAVGAGAAQRVDAVCGLTVRHRGRRHPTDARTLARDVGNRTRGLIGARTAERNSHPRPASAGARRRRHSRRCAPPGGSGTPAWVYSGRPGSPRCGGRAARRRWRSMRRWPLLCRPGRVSSGSERPKVVKSARSSRPTSAATAANTSSGVAALATRAATRRSAACSSMIRSVTAARQDLRPAAAPLRQVPHRCLSVLAARGESRHSGRHAAPAVLVRNVGRGPSSGRGGAT